MERLNDGKEIIDILEQHNFQAYFVGGCVRDFLLNRKTHDIDICTSATPDQVLEIFDHAIPTGIKHGTVTVIWRDKPYEITTFRTEGEYSNFRSPDHISFVHTLQEDLQRRDFTINAIAMDKNGGLYDYFGGREDLNQQVIRAVGDPLHRFSEDALRMLRALRFSAQLNFDVLPEVREAITSLREQLQFISMERITAEFEKIMEAPFVRTGLKTLLSVRFHEDVYPFLFLRTAIPRAIELPLEGLTPLERWVFLLSCQSSTPADESYFQFLTSLTLTKKFMKKVKELSFTLSTLSSCTNVEEIPVMDRYRLGREMVRAILRINQLRVNGRIAETVDDEVRAVYKQLPIQQAQELAITGRDLITLWKREPGPWVQEQLTRITEAIITGRVENNKAKILSYILECEDRECN